MVDWWHRRRRRVLAVIAFEPDMGEWEICRASGLSRWEVRHHLLHLTTEGKITSRWSSRTRYPRHLMYQVVTTG